MNPDLIPPLNEEIFQALMALRDDDSTFTFPLRSTNHFGRLAARYWFLGNDNYICVGLYKANDRLSATYTISLIFHFRANGDIVPRIHVIMADPRNFP